MHMIITHSFTSHITHLTWHIVHRCHVCLGFLAFCMHCTWSEYWNLNTKGKQFVSSKQRNSIKSSRNIDRKKKTKTISGHSLMQLRKKNPFYVYISFFFRFAFEQNSLPSQLSLLPLSMKWMERKSSAYYQYRFYFTLTAIWRLLLSDSELHK